MSRFYLDSNVLIYVVEQPPRFGERAVAFLTGALRNGDEIVISDLALAESVYGAVKKGLSAHVEAYGRLTQDARRLTLAAVNSNALASAARLGPGVGLKLVDAIHLATAMDAGCAGFVTNDRAFAKVTDIKIINPFDGT